MEQKTVQGICTNLFAGLLRSSRPARVTLPLRDQCQIGSRREQFTQTQQNRRFQGRRSLLIRHYPIWHSRLPGLTPVFCSDATHPLPGPSGRGRELPLGVEPVVPVGADGLALLARGDRHGWRSARRRDAGPLSSG